MGKLATEEDCSASLEALVDVAVEDFGARYAMGDCIGEGRFSKVYTANPVGGGKPVALKEVELGVLEEDEEALEMLEAEVNALRRAVGTDHVVNLVEVVASSDAVFLAMERVPGRELFELIEERGALPGALVSELIRQLLMALESLATLGVVRPIAGSPNLYFFSWSCFCEEASRGIFFL